MHLLLGWVVNDLNLLVYLGAGPTNKGWMGQKDTSIQSSSPSQICPAD